MNVCTIVLIRSLAPPSFALIFRQARFPHSFFLDPLRSSCHCHILIVNDLGQVYTKNRNHKTSCSLVGIRTHPMRALCLLHTTVHDKRTSFELCQLAKNVFVCNAPCSYPHGESNTQFPAIFHAPCGYLVKKRALCLFNRRKALFLSHSRKDEGGSATISDRKRQAIHPEKRFLAAHSIP